MALRSLTWQEKHARGTLSVLVSCIVHTSLFIGLALWYVNSQLPVTNIVLQAAIAGGEDVSLEFAELPNVEPPAGELTESQVLQSQELDLNITPQLTRSQSHLNATLTSALVDVERSARGAVGDGDGSGEGGDALAKLGANFFGTYAQGNKFLFVLDSSRSMTGDRWLYACQELMDSISRLQPHQKFFVICFDDKTTCMFNTPPGRVKYYNNDQDTRDRLRRWLATRKLGPGTFPAMAMIMALKMNPDAIFLLSDGELRDDTLFRLRDVNGFSTERRQVPVHTIHLMSLEGRATLQLIATENSGTFTPVQGGG